MFERYSEKAKRVIFFARYEASQFGTRQIDTEHLLLGLLREDRDLLPSLVGPGVNEKIRHRIRQQYPTRDQTPTTEDLPFSEASKHMLNYAMEEADQSESYAITHKHILIGLLRDQNSVTSKILTDVGLSYEGVRKQLN